MFYSAQVKTNIPSSAVLISESVQWIIGITARSSRGKTDKVSDIVTK